MVTTAHQKSSFYMKEQTFCQQGWLFGEKNGIFDLKIMQKNKE
jgi:hypothetical protein